MNKIETTEIGGFPFVLDDIRFMQDSWRLAFLDISKALFNQHETSQIPFNALILWGGEVTEHSTYVEISEGALYYDGEIYHIYPHSTPTTGGITSVLLYMIEENDPVGTKMFLNGNTYDTYKVRKAVLSESSIPGAIQSTFVPLLNRIPTIFDIAPQEEPHVFSHTLSSLENERIKLNRQFNRCQFSIHTIGLSAAVLTTFGSTPTVIASIPEKYRPVESVIAHGYCKYNSSGDAKILEQSFVFTLSPNGDLISQMLVIPDQITAHFDLIVNSPTYIAKE